MAGKEPNVISKKVNKEMITSHKLSITVLIRNFCLYRDDGWFKMKMLYSYHYH